MDFPGTRGKIDHAPRSVSQVRRRADQWFADHAGSGPLRQQDEQDHPRQQASRGSWSRSKIRTCERPAGLLGGGVFECFAGGLRGRATRAGRGLGQLRRASLRRVWASRDGVSRARSIQAWCSRSDGHACGPGRTHGEIGACHRAHQGPGSSGCAPSRSPRNDRGRPAALALVGSDQPDAREPGACPRDACRNRGAAARIDGYAGELAVWDCRGGWSRAVSWSGNVSCAGTGPAGDRSGGRRG
jgi:hypothetical protein